MVILTRSPSRASRRWKGATNDARRMTMVERTGYADGEPCWADELAPDVDAAQRFYGAVFGWTFRSTGPEFGNYVLCLRGDRAVAGISPPMDPSQPPPAWSLYLATSDADETARRIETNGGTILAS